MLVSLWWQLVRFGFRLLYNEMAWTYDAVSWIVSLGEWRSWQRAAIKHLNVLPGVQVLELAHGTANLQIDLRTAGLDSVGVDLSPFMGQIARRKLLRQRIIPKLARCRAQALPFPDNSFPAIVSTFPTDFIVDPKTLAEIYRILKPGGRLVFIPNGQLTGGGVAREGLEAAYRITGQRGPWPVRIEERFTEAGFTLSSVVEPCRISVAQVVIVEKPPRE
ncbi:MAG: class I SAM-dependent methyltransferase [Anaerolineae bacterium]|nr:class I SAM-dependent methyltransferase [Anaerolineae bacterium]